LDIVTPNYDRLIEYHLEKLGIAVDTGYNGTYFARYDASRSVLANKEYHQDGRRVRTVVHPHARVHKPHGSLDWYIVESQAIRCPHQTSLPRAIITPGLTKYQNGYCTHFSQQRETASAALSRAQRVLVIGYGFNDDQLEHSWCSSLTSNKRLVILTKKLSPKAFCLLRNSPNALAVCEDPSDASRSLVYQGDGDPRIYSRPLWTVNHFVKEVIR
jgi:hypothetical protein